MTSLQALDRQLAQQAVVEALAKCGVKVRWKLGEWPHYVFRTNRIVLPPLPRNPTEDDVLFTRGAGFHEAAHVIARTSEHHLRKAHDISDRCGYIFRVAEDARVNLVYNDDNLPGARHAIRELYYVIDRRAGDIKITRAWNAACDTLLFSPQDMPGRGDRYELDALEQYRYERLVEIAHGIKWDARIQNARKCAQMLPLAKKLHELWLEFIEEENARVKPTPGKQIVVSKSDLKECASQGQQSAPPSVDDPFEDREQDTVVVIEDEDEPQDEPEADDEPQAEPETDDEPQDDDEDEDDESEADESEADESEADSKPQDESESKADGEPPDETDDEPPDEPEADDEPQDDLPESRNDWDQDDLSDNQSTIEDITMDMNTRCRQELPYQPSTEWDRVLDVARDKLPYNYSGYGVIADPEVIRSTESMVSTLRSRMVLDLRGEGNPITHNQRSGRLDHKRLHRVASGRDDVFMARKPDQDLDTAVTLLVDQSGSMYGDPTTSVDNMRARLAWSLAYALGQTCGAIDVSYEIRAFTTCLRDRYQGMPSTNDRNELRETQGLFGYDRDCALLTYIVKHYRERLSRQTLLSRIVKTTSSHNYGTIIGEAVELAWKQLLTRRERRKVLILITDGVSSQEDDEKRIAKLVEASPVELIAVGIGTAKVTENYRNSILYDDPSQLLTDFYPKLRKILRGA